ncbi:hypothetical protein RchiOBHm_Chr2g0147211 [Rosa chinensis]|uniref:Uncharacterized protein n=1 Tax=Rosa chinensis TaxID=74649 RepID=A0A2P6RZ24_ROSCH|nr:hypothetical protein RchiOBHm_Chr2g0147211 [Rosa chinensis]
MISYASYYTKSMPRINGISKSVYTDTIIPPFHKCSCIYDLYFIQACIAVPSDTCTGLQMFELLPSK